MIPERPPLFVMVAGVQMELQDRGPIQPYVRPQRPYLGLEYWRTGQQLTEAQALPLLREVLGPAWMPPEVPA